MGDIENLLKEGITALKAGQRTKARALLREVVRQCPDDVTAWLWLSGAVETDAARRQCLEKVLMIDPRNPYAQRGLEKLPLVVPPQEASESSPIAAGQPLATKSPTGTCPHCGAKVQIGKRFCAICGKELAESAVTPSQSARIQKQTSVVSRRSPSQPGGKGRKKNRRLTFWVVSGLLLTSLCCCGAMLLNLTNGTGTSSRTPDSSRSTPTPDVGTAVGAHLICQEYVKDRLVAPSSAEWPKYGEVQVFKIKDKTSWWQVHGFVDAQNRMGVFLRLNYVCLVEYKGSDGIYDNWELVDLQLEE